MSVCAQGCRKTDWDITYMARIVSGHKVERLDPAQLDMRLKPHLLEHAPTRDARHARVIHKEKCRAGRDGCESRAREPRGEWE